MSVHLMGGGWDAGGEVYGPFVAEAAARAAGASGRDTDASGRAIPRVAVVVVRADDPDALAERFVADLRSGGEVSAHVTAVRHGEPIPRTAFADVDGVMVGGGSIPAYRDALEEHFGELRRLVADGVPYLGYSAGSAVAAEQAIIGGYRIGGVDVAPEPVSQGLDEVQLAPGIGLVDIAIDVHAAQWGALSRVVAAVEAGLIAGGLAIDERTVLVVGDGGLVVAGRGSVWRVLPGEQGVVVSTMGA
ncbi:Type 1 glutamine amidotransferase-like domain-containing protein [Agromyces sp. LHK192]|uniref:Type 1 glutamine amidotransferase-like domain-containing protein n=1 Tax=Agromyces sp. LHK192 TaxID=2498704 RepID=UPI001F0C76CC|nr:Type 1 glutamine amidotransferase-like domain-containing protein [Agromyces sp. LHK192]